MTTTTDQTSATVPGRRKTSRAQQAEPAPAYIRGAEPAVWTRRMLTALNVRAQGTTWFRLYDKVFSQRNLLAAFERVAKKNGAPGVDHVTVQNFERQLPDQIRNLSEEIRLGRYRPSGVRRVHIEKPGTNETRPLGIPTVCDRVVQGAVVNVIEPIFDKDFAEHSYGFRKGRGCKDALRRVDALLKQGYVHVVDADLKSYFDTIPHDLLMQRLRTKISDGSVLRLIEMFLKANIMDGLREWTPEAGAPQGAVLSPLLSNIYLDPLDHLLASSGFEMVRYADDFVILCRTAEDAHKALELVRQWTTTAGLTLHPTKTKIVDVRTEGFAFLGYQFQGTTRRPREKSLKKLKDTIRAKTPRKSGRSLECMIHDVNVTLRGWFGYFQHCTPHYVFLNLDQWIRMRLRSVLRKRSGRSGRGRGRDHYRWPNRYFAERGLFSLDDAHTKAVQSAKR